MRLSIALLLATSLVATVVLVSGLEEVCPRGCVCFGQSITCRRAAISELPRLPKSLPGPEGGALQYFAMTQTNLAHIPAGAFSGHLDLTSIDLFHNQLEKIDADAFTNLPSLSQLALFRNMLTSLPDEMFDGLPGLEELDLSFNKLTVLPSSLERLVSLKKLKLRGNPLHCPCSIVNLAGLLPALEESGNRAVCASPHDVAGKRIAEIGMHYKTAFEGTRHLGFYPDEQRYPEEDDRKALMRVSGSNWPLPHCREEDLGGEMEDAVGEEGAPVIVDPPEPVMVAEGEKVFFVCEATGVPTPKIRWILPTNQTQFVRMWNRRRILQLVEVHAYHEGTITCVAENRFGSTRHSVDLQLLQIVKPQIVEAPSAQTMAGGPGSDLELVCAARGRPKPKMDWLYTHTTSARRLTTRGRYTVRSGSKLTTRSTSDLLASGNNVEDEDAFRLEGAEESVTLIIRNITEQDTEGRYTCYASNRAGSARVTSVISMKKSMTVQDDMSMYSTQKSGGEMLESDEDIKITGHESSEELVRRVIEKARRRIDAAIQKTADNLRDPSNRRTASDIASLFRQPSKAAVELARAAEVYEAAIDEVTQILQRQRNATLDKDDTDTYRGDVDYDEQKRQAMGVQLSAEQLAIIAQLSGCAQSQRVEPCDRQLCYHLRYRSIDGGCNNLKFPRWGAALAPFYRLLPPVYENGVNQPVGWNPERKYFGYPKPSARLVSYKLLGDATSLEAHTKRLETFNERIRMSLRFNNQTHDSSSPFDFPVEGEELFDEDQDTSGMLMQWGQFLDHDLDFTPVDASTSRFSDGLGCNETCINDPPCFPILTPPGDPRIRQRCIGFARSSATCGSGSTSILLGRPQHREQLNQITAFIDASNVYASEDFESAQLRNTLYDEGHLREGIPTPSGKKLLPFNIRGQVDCQADPQQDFVPCFKAGDHRSNENLGLLSMHTIWMREHNRIADELRSLNPHWSGDRIYQESRKIVGALMQSITYRVWLPKVLGKRGMEMLGKHYPGYDATVNPTISNEFATAAFRFGHTLVAPIIFRLNERWEAIPEGHLLLHKAFFAPDRMLTDGGLDPILRGLLFHGVRDIIRKPSLNPELTERLFAMAHQLALDLASLNVQRGRDHGLQHYTAYSYKICGLGSSAAPDSFEDLKDRIKDAKVRETLRSVYGHPGNIDLFVGGILEDVMPGARVGPTFACIIAEQFKRLRAGDRLWFESPGLFSTAQLGELRDAGSLLSRVVCENGDNITAVPVDAFLRPKGRQDLVSCSQVPKLNLALWKECPSTRSTSFGAYSDVGRFTEEPLNRRRRSLDAWEGEGIGEGVCTSISCDAGGSPNFVEDLQSEIETRMNIEKHRLRRRSRQAAEH